MRQAANLNTLAGVEIGSLHLPVGPVMVEPHWLLATWYGRDLLKVALGKLRPDLPINYYLHCAELDGYLETVIDELQLRNWPEPRSLLARCRFVLNVGAMFPAVARRERPLRPFPD